MSLAALDHILKLKATLEAKAKAKPAATQAPAKKLLWGLSAEPVKGPVTIRPGSESGPSDEEDEDEAERQRGEEEGEQLMSDDGGVETVEMPPDVDVDWPKLPGVKNYGTVKATTGRPCLVCSENFDVGDFYVEYRLRYGASMKDLRRTHGRCCALLPKKTREVDRLVIEKWLLGEDDVGQTTELDAILAAMDAEVG